MPEDQALAGLKTGGYSTSCCLVFKDLTLPTYSQLQGFLSGCGCSTSPPTGVQWLVDKAGLTPSWLHADGPQGPFPGSVYIWSGEQEYGMPGYYWLLELKTGSKGLAPYWYSEYYLPVRVPAPSELPFYP
jgi:hypothetical protein